MGLGALLCCEGSAFCCPNRYQCPKWESLHSARGGLGMNTRMQTPRAPEQAKRVDKMG